jgi:glycolate oxidase iron-sulfur subunit
LALLNNIAMGKKLSPAAGLFLDCCLGCRACHSVCPTGVDPAREVRAVRQPLVNNLSGLVFAWIWRTACRAFVPRPGRLAFLLRILRSTHRTGLSRLLSRLPFLGALGARLDAVAAFLSPTAPLPHEKRPRVLPATGREKCRAAFFTGCIMEAALRPANDAAITLLRSAGCTVIVPPAQTCCGALSYHSGDYVTARKLALENLNAFALEGPFDVIVSAAAACTAHLRSYPDLFEADPELREKAQGFATRVRDFTHLLHALQPHLTAPSPGRVAYHESCLLRHSGNPGALGEVLSLVAEVEPFPAPHLGCCGSAGGYAFRHPDVASALLDAEIGALCGTGATTVVTDNPGCLLFLRYGLTRHNLQTRIKVQHVAEYLNKGGTP